MSELKKKEFLLRLEECKALEVDFARDAAEKIERYRDALIDGKINQRQFDALSEDVRTAARMEACAGDIEMKIKLEKAVDLLIRVAQAAI